MLRRGASYLQGPCAYVRPSKVVYIGAVPVGSKYGPPHDQSGIQAAKVKALTNSDIADFKAYLPQCEEFKKRMLTYGRLIAETSFIDPAAPQSVKELHKEFEKDALEQTYEGSSCPTQFMADLEKDLTAGVKQLVLFANGHSAPEWSGVQFEANGDLEMILQSEPLVELLKQFDSSILIGDMSGGHFRAKSTKKRLKSSGVPEGARYLTGKRMTTAYSTAAYHNRYKKALEESQEGPSRYTPAVGNLLTDTVIECLPFDEDFEKRFQYAWASHSLTAKFSQAYRAPASDGQLQQLTPEFSGNWKSLPFGDVMKTGSGIGLPFNDQPFELTLAYANSGGVGDPNLPALPSDDATEEVRDAWLESLLGFSIEEIRPDYEGHRNLVYEHMIESRLKVLGCSYHAVMKGGLGSTVLRVGGEDLINKIFAYPVAPERLAGVPMFAY